MENSDKDEYICPSFNTYSSNRLAEVALIVAAEKNEEHNNDDEDFEFSLVREENDFSAEEFAYDGQIGPIFPVFNRDLLQSSDGEFREDKLESNVQIPLSKLFIEDRNDHHGDNPPSCSSSEADELENIPAGTYCVWRPKSSAVAADQPPPGRCKKSSSTGSASKRWKFRDLLRRSNSEGKDSFVFLTPKNREEKLPTEAPKKGKGKGVGGGGGSGAPQPPPKRSAHEALYVRNRMIKEGDKKKSYLPYRRDLVGFFVNVNVLSRGLPHL